MRLKMKIPKLDLYRAMLNSISHVTFTICICFFLRDENLYLVSFKNIIQRFDS